MHHLLTRFFPFFVTIFFSCFCNAQTVEDVVASESNWLGISTFEFANYLNSQQVADEDSHAIRSIHFKLYETADRELVQRRKNGEISAEEFIDLEERILVNLANQNATFFSEEELRQFVLNACRETIQAESRMSDSSDVGSFLHEKVATVLKLRSDQRDIIEQSRLDLNSTLEILGKKRAKKLQELLTEHFESCREILNSSQRELFDGLHGPPINWLMFSPHLVRRIERPYISTGGGISKIKANRKKDGSSSAEFPSGLAKETYLLLTGGIVLSDQVLSEIELTDAQKEEFARQVAFLWQFTKSSGSESDLRLKQLLKREADLPHPFESVLLPHQKPWIRQLEFQIFMFKERRSFGLLNSSFEKTLQLTSEQTQEVVKKKKEFVEKLALETPSIEKELAGARQKAFAYIYGSLTNKQKLTYDRLIGAPQFKK